MVFPMNKLANWVESSPATQVVAISFENIELFLFIVIASLALLVCTVFIAALSGSWQQPNHAAGTPDLNADAFLPGPNRLSGVRGAKPE